MATLAILLGMGAITVSCQKEERTVKKAKVTANQCVYKTGDEDDEDPVIQGRVRKKNLSPINNAQVETFAYGGLLAGTKYTDSSGYFTQRVNAGIYYFRITPPSSSVTYVTDTISVTGPTMVTIMPY